MATLLDPSRAVFTLWARAHDGWLSQGGGGRPREMVHHSDAPDETADFYREVMGADLDRARFVHSVDKAEPTPARWEVVVSVGDLARAIAQARRFGPACWDRSTPTPRSEGENPMTSAETASIHVATEGGDDSGPGTGSRPFATVARAQREVCALTPTMTTDVIVELHPGVHALSQPLELSAAAGDAGLNGRRVVYRAHGWDGVSAKEPVILSGGRTVSDWEPDGERPGRLVCRRRKR